MTTELLDSTVSQLMQDNSSVEYIDALENPIATIPKTIRSRIETLVNTGNLDEGKIFPSLNVPNHTGNGAVKTTLYNLTVFNKLAATPFSVWRNFALSQ